MGFKLLQQFHVISGDRTTDSDIGQILCHDEPLVNEVTGDCSGKINADTVLGFVEGFQGILRGFKDKIGSFNVFAMIETTGVKPRRSFSGTINMQDLTY